MTLGMNIMYKGLSLSGMLCCVCLQLLTDVSRQPIRPNLNWQAVQDYQHTLRNIAEE